ncbi:partial Regulatory protein AtoC, partial [Anaerolineae bacterium]
MKKILIADDEDCIRLVLSEFLTNRGFGSCQAKDGFEAVALFQKERPDAVLLDLSMPGMDGMEALGRLTTIDPSVPVIILTANGEISSAVQAVKCGAFDFISKPPDFEEITMRLSRAIEKAQLRRSLARLSSSVEASFMKRLGKSPAIKAVISQVYRVAPSTFSVIIQGETGTGKSTLAEFIHNLSARSGKPFVRVDIGVIPETIIESELFGHSRGAFTGADRARKGYFESADTGTIFIDELENTSPQVQSKLLSAVEQKKVYPMGASRAVEVDFRLIAAANTDLSGMVRHGKFREDLFYRLSEFTIQLPPLRDRKEDIGFLAERFCEEACEELKRKPLEIDGGAMDMLTAHKWPGNVRELKNVIRRAVLLSSGSALRVDNLTGVLMSSAPANQAPHGILSGEVLPLKEVSSRASSAAEEAAIRQALTLTGGNKTRTATMLRVDYKTLLTKIRQYGLENP